MGGPAKRVWKLDANKIATPNNISPKQALDAAVAEAACVYGKKFHNIIFDNCHCHVALVLNKLHYNGRTDWNQLRVFMAIWRHGQWISGKDRAIVCLPFLIMLGAIISVSCVLAITL